jgi:hemerythrin-like domain-containing protein
MKITEALLVEHQVFHHIFDHLEATVPGLSTLAEVKSLAALLEAMLRTHSATEDELFIGPLEHCFDQIHQRERFHDEHVEIDENLKKVRAAKQLKRARELLLAAVTYSRGHFDREERIVFPMAERSLNARTLADLGKRWMDERTRASASTQLP